MSRSVKEWVGKTDDSKPPASVRARIFLANDGKCHISGRQIRAGDPWEAEHVKPIWAGGQNRESNLKPALVDAHVEKTKAEAGERAKADRIRAKHLGIYPKSKTPLRSRPFAKTRQEIEG